MAKMRSDWPVKSRPSSFGAPANSNWSARSQHVRAASRRGSRGEAAPVLRRQRGVDGGVDLLGDARAAVVVEHQNGTSTGVRLRDVGHRLAEAFDRLLDHGADLCFGEVAEPGLPADLVHQQREALHGQRDRRVLFLGQVNHGHTLPRQARPVRPTSNRTRQADGAAVSSGAHPTSRSHGPENGRRRRARSADARAAAARRPGWRRSSRVMPPSAPRARRRRPAGG